MNVMQSYINQYWAFSSEELGYISTYLTFYHLWVQKRFPNSHVTLQQPLKCRIRSKYSSSFEHPHHLVTPLRAHQQLFCITHVIIVIITYSCVAGVSCLLHFRTYESFQYSKFTFIKKYRGKSKIISFSLLEKRGRPRKLRNLPRKPSSSNFSSPLQVTSLSCSLSWPQTRLHRWRHKANEIAKTQDSFADQSSLWISFIHFKNERLFLLFCFWSELHADTHK